MIEFFKANEWFGVTSEMKNGVPTIAGHDLKTWEKPLTLWLSAYKKPGRDKINLMLQHFSEIYPVTCRLYREFIVKRGVANEPAAWKLLDYLLSEIDREIIEYSEPDLEKLVKPLDAETSLVVANMFADFLRTTTHNGKPLTKWSYSFLSKSSTNLIKSAYSMNDFAIMAYCVFNEEMWIRQGLIEKAVQSKKYADLWLFIALHFICALRIGDMERLPAPSLPYSGEKILEKISGNTFSKQEAVALVEELCIRLKLKPMKPSKTSAHDGIPDIKLSVPESLKAPLGVIMAISLAHHPDVNPGEGFVFPSKGNLNTVKTFFGEHFVKALGKRNFTSIGCNKSFMQGISSVADIDNIVGTDSVTDIGSVACTDNPPGKPKGYMFIGANLRKK